MRSAGEETILRMTGRKKLEKLLADHLDLETPELSLQKIHAVLLKQAGEKRTVQGVAMTVFNAITQADLPSFWLHQALTLRQDIRQNWLQYIDYLVEDEMLRQDARVALCLLWTSAQREQPAEHRCHAGVGEHPYGGWRANRA